MKYCKTFHSHSACGISCHASCALVNISVNGFSIPNTYPVQCHVVANKRYFMIITSFTLLSEMPSLDIPIFLVYTGRFKMRKALVSQASITVLAKLARPIKLKYDII